MNNDMDPTAKTRPGKWRETMPEQQLYKAGDTFVVPVTFQLLKVFGHEDRVYYLCAPVDNAKRSVCLKNPFFITCLEQGEDSALDEIPASVIERAFKFVNLELEDQEDDDEEEDA